MTHDGSLGHAIRMAEVAAECGVDAVKFQLHDAEAETTRDAPSPPYFKHETRWEYFERTAFTDDQWGTLKQACEAAGVEFLCSAFSTARRRAARADRRLALQDRLRRGHEPRARARGRRNRQADAPDLGDVVVGRARRRRRGGRRPGDGPAVHVAVPDAVGARRPERARAAARALRQAGRLLRPHARELRGVRRGDARGDGGREALHALARPLRRRRALRDRAARVRGPRRRHPRARDDAREPRGQGRPRAVRRDEAGVREVGRHARRKSRPAPRSPARWWRPRSRARASPRGMLPEVLGRTARVDIAADTVLTEDLLA